MIRSLHLAQMAATSPTREQGRGEIAVVAAAADERPTKFQIAGTLTAIAYSKRGALLCADASGDILELSADDPAPSSSASGPSRLANFDGPIAAFADFYGDDDRRHVVAALADGRVAIQEPGLSSRSYDLLPWRPRWITVFPDRKAAMAGSQALGVSIAVTGAEGEFDIVGVDSAAGDNEFNALSLLDHSIEPSRDELAVLAINPERRRIIVRNGSYLEVRPLVYDLPEVGETVPAFQRISVPEQPAEEADRGGAVPA